MKGNSGVTLTTNPLVTTPSALTASSAIAAESSHYLSEPYANSTGIASLQDKIDAIIAEKERRNADLVGGVIRLFKKLFGSPEEERSDTEVFKAVISEAQRDPRAGIINQRLQFVVPGFENDYDTLSQAVHDADQEISNNPINPTALHAKGKAELQLVMGARLMWDKFNPVKDKLYQDLEMFDTQVQASNLLKETQRSSADDAAKYLRQAADLGGQDPDIYFQLAVVDLMHNRKKSAKNNLDKVTELSGDKFVPYLHHFKALTLDPSQARKELLEEVKHNPNVDSYIYLGDVCTQRKDYKGSLEYLSLAKEMAPGAMMVNLNIGRAYFAQNDMDRALEYYQQEIDNSHNFPQNTYSRHEAYKEMGLIYLNHKDDPEKACEFFDLRIQEADNDKKKHHQRYELKGLSLMAHAEKHRKASPQDHSKAKDLAIKAEKEFSTATYRRDNEYDNYSNLARARLDGVGFDTAMESINKRLADTQKSSSNNKRSLILVEKVTLLIEMNKFKEAREVNNEIDPFVKPYLKMSKEIEAKIEKGLGDNNYSPEISSPRGEALQQQTQVASRAGLRGGSK